MGRTIYILALSVSLAGTLPAQREQRQTLSEVQIEKIREAGIDPNLRISLYTDFLNERADTIRKLTSRANSAARAKRLDDELMDFTSLMDELGSNLDQYGDRKADMRLALKKLNDVTPKWLGILRALPGEPSFDESRKEAIESCDDLTGDASRLQTEQIVYFKTHKEEKGQEREEPR
jgi:hypothetical protein